jgi:hypothetical protein
MNLPNIPVDVIFRIKDFDMAEQLAVIANELEFRWWAGNYALFFYPETYVSFHLESKTVSLCAYLSHVGYDQRIYISPAQISDLRDYLKIYEDANTPSADSSGGGDVCASAGGEP